METGNHEPDAGNGRGAVPPPSPASRGDLLTDLGLARPAGWVRQWGQGAILGTALMLALFFTFRAVGAVRVQGWLGHEDLTRAGILLAAAGAVGRFLFFAGLEEVIFRGLLLQELGRRMPLFGAVILSSLGFSLFHLLNPNVQVLAFVNLFLFGIWFALLFLRTGTLWLVWGAHFAYNLWESMICSLPVSGKEGFHLLAVEVILSPLTGGDFGPEGGWVCTVAVGLACVLTGCLGRKGTDGDGRGGKGREPKEMSGEKEG